MKLLRSRGYAYLKFFYFFYEIYGVVSLSFYEHFYITYLGTNLSTKMCNLVEKCCVFTQRQILPPYNLGQNISRQVRYVTIVSCSPFPQCNVVILSLTSTEGAAHFWNTNKTQHCNWGWEGGVVEGGAREREYEKERPD